MKASAFAIIAVLAMSAQPAYAQATPEQTEMFYNSARNQLGILNFCQTEGHIDGTAVEIQERIIGFLPAPTDPAAGDAAQATGEVGTIEAMGVNQDLQQAAETQGASVEQFCDALAATVGQAGSQLPQ